MKLKEFFKNCVLVAGVEVVICDTNAEILLISSNRLFLCEFLGEHEVTKWTFDCKNIIVTINFTSKE